MVDKGFSVEVAYAQPDAQELIKLRLPPGTTVLEAVEASGLAERFPEIDLNQLDAGVFSKPVSSDAMLRAGDRVEIYRKLKLNPKEQRRLRAKRAD